MGIILPPFKQVFLFRHGAKTDHMCCSLSPSSCKGLFIISLFFPLSLSLLLFSVSALFGSGGRRKELNGSSCSATSVSCCLAPSSFSISSQKENDGFWLLLLPPTNFPMGILSDSFPTIVDHPDLSRVEDRMHKTTSHFVDSTRGMHIFQHLLIFLVFFSKQRIPPPIQCPR